MLFRDFECITGVHLLGNYTSWKMEFRLVGGRGYNGYGIRRMYNKKYFRETKQDIYNSKKLRICKDRNVLKEYLERKEQEVVDMLMELYDQEEVMRSYMESEKYDAAKEIAQRLLKMGKFSIEDIAVGSGLTLEEVEELASLQSV